MSRWVASVQDVAHVSARGGALCYAAEDGQMLLSTHWLVNLLIGLLVDYPTTSVFDLHRRLQSHSCMATDMGLTLSRLSPQGAGLGKGSRAF